MTTNLMTFKVSNILTLCDVYIKYDKNYSDIATKCKQLLDNLIAQKELSVNNYIYIDTLTRYINDNVKMNFTQNVTCDSIDIDILKFIVSIYYDTMSMSADDYI